jgi:hypothetical protein
MGISKARATAVAVGLGLCFGLIVVAPAMAAEPGTIEGRVTEPEEGEGLFEIEVCAKPATPADPPGACVGTEDGSGLGPRGHFELSGLEAGSYKIAFLPPRDDSEKVTYQYVSQYYPHKLTLAAAKSVELEGGAVKQVNAVLEVGGIVEGKVTSVGGVPLQGVEACVFDELVAEFGIRCAQTQATGLYRIIGLAPGSYKASFEAPESRNLFPQFFSDAGSVAEARDFPVLPGQETLDIDAALLQGSELEGTVLEVDSGLPLEGIRVCALNALTEAEVRCTATDEDGSYRIRQLPPSVYVAAFSVAQILGGIPVGEDGFVRQYYEDQPSFAAADPIDARVPGSYRDVDAHLLAGPEVFPRPPVASTPEEPIATPTAAVPPAAPPAKFRCRKHFRKKLVKGERRCVRVARHHHRHKPR